MSEQEDVDNMYDDDDAVWVRWWNEGSWVIIFNIFYPQSFHLNLCANIKLWLHSLLIPFNLFKETRPPPASSHVLVSLYLDFALITRDAAMLPRHKSHLSKGCPSALGAPKSKSRGLK